MAIWTFYDYVSDTGTNHVAKWIRKELSVQERTDLDALLEILSKQVIWGQTDYKTIVNGQGLGEIRWKGQNRRTLRLLGLPDVTVKTFVCLLGCTHKDNRYQPHDWLNTAIGRMKALQRNEGTTVER